MRNGNRKFGEKIVETIRKQRTLFVCICAMVVFVTTYLLILPAITLDKDTAKDQGGIDLPKAEQVQNEDQTSKEADKAATEAQPAGELSYEGDGYTVEAAFDAKAGLPEDTSLKASEIESDDEDYDSWRDEALKAVQEAKGGERITDFEFAKFYDISLMADGQEVEPDAPVDISISYDKALKAADADHVRIIHFGADKKGNPVTEVLDPDDVDLDLEKGSMSGTAFAAESFSVYGVVYTVDFSWEVDGEEYEFSLPGGGFISLQELVKSLKVVNDDVQNFAAEVESAEFSDPDLLWVGKVEEDTTVGELKKANKLDCQYSEELTEDEIEEINAKEIKAGDWALISLQPFLSTESLVVTMKDGEVFTVRVTDGQIKKTVISTKGDTYEITVAYGDDAKIPDGAELKVDEIQPEEEAYKDLQKKAKKKLKEELCNEIPSNPVLFDISIYDGDTEIEPAEGSAVSVEIKLVKSSLAGLYSDDNSPILLNEEPFKADAKELTQELKIIHDVSDAGLDIVDVDERDDGEKVVGQFTTESFSNWLVFLDEEVEEITVGRGDTITLRPYSQWVWNQQNSVDGETVSWKTPQTDGHMTVQQKSYTDNQLNQTYSYYQLAATSNPGDFYIETTAGKRIHVTVKGEDVSDVPGTVDGLDTIKVNLFNYDLDHSLDVSQNTAQAIENNWGSYGTDGINKESALKFLGWGASNGSNNVWINNYVATSPTTNIVQSTLGTGTDGKKYPRLNGNGNTNLQYLFSSGNADVDAHMNVPGLFRQDEDGYYYFNSNTNYARYKNGEFILYEHTYTQETTRNNQQYPEENSKPIGFFPFHDYDSNNNLSPNHNTSLDHHFGLSMEVKFVLPPDKKLHKAGGATDDIIFEFSGDDDMWVFVDDNLSLDVGGIHQPITGRINFTEDSRFQGGQEYTLRIFYLERGGCDSNCSIRFNIPLTKRPFSFEKQDAQDKTKFLKGAKFGLFKDAACKIAAVDDTSGEEYTAISNDNGVVSFPSVSIGTYYMKELEAPQGYRLEETVRLVKLTENGVTIQGDADSGREGVQIANQKNPELTVEKEWQNQAGAAIAAPEGASATFELKRYVSYEGDVVIPNTSQPCTFRVYRSKSGQTPKQEGSDYVFKGGTSVNVNWGYDSGYLEYSSSRKRHYGESSGNDQLHEKPANSPAVIELPESGTVEIYIHDEDLNTGYDPGVINITVEGTPYTPDGRIEHVSSDWAEDGEYVGPELTLPSDKIDEEHPWKGKFSNLVVSEIKNGITYHYKYYIVEKEKTPNDSTVVYVDGTGAVISDPATQRTDENGNQKVINKVPNGGLKLRKWVTIGGVSPEDEPDLKDKADGEYTFTVSGIADTQTAGISKTVVIKIENGKATRAWIDGTETAFDNANDLFVEIPDLLPGDYTITEEPLPPTIKDVWLNSVFGGKDDGNVETKKITVTVTSGKSGDDIENTGKATFTNNYSPDSEEDIAHISIKKKFEGLPEGTTLDDDFKITIEVADKTYELTSNPTDPAVTFDGSHFPTCYWTVSVKGMLKDTPVKVSEVNAGYPAYDVTTSVNGENSTSYTGTVSSSTVIDAFAPKIYEANNKKDFNVTNTQIFMALLTDDHVLVISKNRLSLSERAAIEKLLAGTGEQTMSEGQWGKKLPPYYYVADENRPVHFKGATITYNNDIVHFDKKCHWTHTAEVAITYNPGNPADFNFVNTYTEKSIGMEILKVDAKDMKTPLKDAGFEIREIDPETTAYKSEEVIYPTTSGTNHKTGADGKASFSGLTEGYYEVKEASLPAGYVQTGDGLFYIRVHDGDLSLVERDSTAETGWKERSSGGELLFQAAEGDNAALVTMGNTAGAELPSSGGPGTTWIYLIGSILLLGCGTILAARRRTRKAE